MPPRETKADLQKKLDYWIEKYKTKCGDSDKEMAKFLQEREERQLQLNIAAQSLDRIRRLWNHWQLIDKGDEGRPGVIQLPRECIEELLVEMPLCSHHIYDQRRHD